MKVQFQVSKDRHTLWVNSGTGMNIARFSSKGIDIHNDVEGQKKHGKQCLFCTHGSDPFNPVPFVQDWELFKAKLLEHHGIRVPARVKMSLRTTPRNTNMNKVAIRRLHAPVQEVTINLEQWEDRRVEDGIQKGLNITLKEASEPDHKRGCLGGVFGLTGYGPCTCGALAEFDLELRYGIGQYARGAHEMMLFGIRGSGQDESVFSGRRDIPSVFFAPNPKGDDNLRIHSRKPDATYELIEARSNGPYAEIFARRSLPGWTSWGSELQPQNEVL